MVSEHGRGSYAAVLTGEMNQQAQPAASPVQTEASSTIPQRTSARNSSLEEMANPLFLSSTDNPSTVLVNPPLIGSSNYAAWCISMRIALEVKNKWSFIEGSVPMPNRESIEHGAWRRCNLIICSWIFRSVHPSIAASIMHLDQAKEVWDDLRKRFSQCDAQRISTLQNEIYGLKQNNLSVNEYYTRCKTLWEEMNTLRPLPICKCCKCDPRCPCDLVEEIRRDRDIDRVIRFLQGLNEDYANLKANVLILDPLPEVYKVFVMAEKLERQINLVNWSTGSLEMNQANAVHTQDSNGQEATGTNVHNQNFSGNNEVIAAMNSHNSYNFKRNNNGSKGAKCTFCGMNGHTVDKCYKKHGYPLGWVPGFKSKAKQSMNVATGSSSITDLGITSDQIQKLISLLQNQPVKPSSNTSAAITLIPEFKEAPNDQGKCSEINVNINSLFLCDTVWTIDSGATDHIVCALEYFDKYHAVYDVEVNLPTGEGITVQHKGDVRLNEDLWLRDALHIPSFKFNIISVSKLLQDFCCGLTFMSGKCIIQGAHGRLLVQLDKKEAFTYYWNHLRNQHAIIKAQLSSMMIVEYSIKDLAISL
ncbi:PREDICTED: uncharacterized protein LOC109173526 [Ipomoea nil]|uniref:uncharacterized protein LOC109173526 n=1 Tax=Ipomoea nil TaxID=35883 RepID=UPI00090140AF|nr:PREDICTED: uncharacterized protein LOC109173526 [Ipomoea nil]